ncbi:MAG TPA: Hsp20 family protein [Acidiphilium sp.]|nr:MAG: heat-shock protein [Acidiphilium sp. 21-60-14]OYV90001.1 MAG: heat-shock protein [Acidiphilium sp. 37-60-79]OZB39061.1 MAG: heat-shock protein [Acidiphilium sp. 34-60-192]HQT88790.1 Hsp20 family protein [Acidiphilium sp.]HQU24324.1 Hsp20 family protein [Acidiphilium sp.]
MTLDFSPLFRTAIGFDRVAAMLDALPDASTNSYPPYNIEKLSAEDYRITMAVAGFRAEDIELVVKENTLVISGKLTTEASQGETLYRGIAARAFERRFVLADHMVVDGASLENGLLHVALKRVIPESLKPRRISITSTAARPVTTISNDTTAQAA